MISPEAGRLAIEIAEMCGFTDQMAWPPGWCGSPMMVQKWLNESLEPDIIRVACRESIAKKRDGPPDTINYFEKAIIRAHARYAAPLPKVEIIQPQTLKVVGNGHSRKDEWFASLDQIRDAAYGPEGISEGGGPIVEVVPGDGRH